MLFNCPNIYTYHGFPNERQTTFAAFLSNESSHTVPRISLTVISTRPEVEFPPTRRVPIYIYIEKDYNVSKTIALSFSSLDVLLFMYRQFL